MAQQKRAARTQTRKKAASSNRRRTARRAGARRRPQSLINGGLLAVRSGVSGDVNAMQAEIRNLAGDLQDRLNRLNAISRKGATHASEGVQDFIADTLDTITSKAVSQLTGPVQEKFGDLTDEATRMSNKAIKRVSREIDRRPLLTLAIAAGVGYLAGMAMQHRS
jgi:ElaB/YqjD/DUF883 family membrane-anchored ribosome-binding protein